MSKKINNIFFILVNITRILKWIYRYIIIIMHIHLFRINQLNIIKYCLPIPALDIVKDFLTLFSDIVLDLTFSRGSESESSPRKLSSCFEVDATGATNPFPLSSSTLTSRSFNGTNRLGPLLEFDWNLRASAPFLLHLWRHSNQYWKTQTTE